MFIVHGGNQLDWCVSWWPDPQYVSFTCFSPEHPAALLLEAPNGEAPAVALLLHAARRERAAAGIVAAARAKRPVQLVDTSQVAPCGCTEGPPGPDSNVVHDQSRPRRGDCTSMLDVLHRATPAVVAVHEDDVAHARGGHVASGCSGEPRPPRRYLPSRVALVHDEAMAKRAAQRVVGRVIVGER